MSLGVGISIYIHTHIVHAYVCIYLYVCVFVCMHVLYILLLYFAIHASHNDPTYGSQRAAATLNKQ